MIRLAHTALLAVLVAVALIAYGLKQEVRERRAEIDRIKADQARVTAEIRTLQVEWRHLSSPDRLRALSRRLHGDDQLRDPEGAPLSPWRAEQIVDLQAPAEAASSAPARLRLAAERRGTVATGSVPTQ